MIRENRKYGRFIAQDNAFAALRAGFKKVGKINDISTNGLSFSYLSRPAETKESEDYLFVDIFLSGDKYHLSHVPCEMVYEIPDAGFLTIDNTAFFRCGLEFKQLNPRQIDQLNIFIENYTKGSLSS